MRRFSHALPSPHTHILANTVAQNESLYSKREVDDAKQARKLSRMLAFPTNKQPTIADNSFYPTTEYDSFNHGGESAIIEDSYNQEFIAEPAEQKIENNKRLGVIPYKMPPITLQRILQKIPHQ